MYFCPFQNLSPLPFSYLRDDQRIHSFVNLTLWPKTHSSTLLFVCQNHPGSRWAQESEDLLTVCVPVPLTVGYKAFCGLHRRPPFFFWANERVTSSPSVKMADRLLDEDCSKRSQFGTGEVTVMTFAPVDLASCFLLVVS